MKKMVALIGALGLISVVTTASAAQYTTWNFENLNGTFTNPVDAAACGSANSLACQVSLTVGGQTILARAYSTPGSSTSGGTLVGATIARHTDSGLGVTSAGSDTSAFVDTSGRYDLIVFEAPTDDFKWTGLELGWVNPGTSDIQTWVGNGPGSANAYDFTNMCLSTSSATCTASNSINGGTSSITGFQSLGTYLNPGADTPINLNPGTKTGRYLVVAGELNLTSDSTGDGFKIKSVTGTPEPQVLALLGLGFLAMLGLSRKRKYS